MDPSTMRPIGLLLLFAVSACSADPAVLPDVPSGCTPGASLACTCTSGANGAQVCGADRTLALCVCDDGGRSDVVSIDAADDRPGPMDVGGMDVGTDAGTPDVGTLDVGFDGGLDAGTDVGTDAGTDAGTADVQRDAGTDRPDVPPDNGGACRSPAECPRPPNASPRCEGGDCRFFCVPSNYGDCDENPTNGCETDTLTDARNCGRCGQACPSFRPRCVSGICVN